MLTTNNIILEDDSDTIMASKVFFGFNQHQSVIISDRQKGLQVWLKIAELDLLHGKKPIKHKDCIGYEAGKAFKIHRGEDKITIWRIQ